MRMYRDMKGIARVTKVPINNEICTQSFGIMTFCSQGLGYSCSAFELLPQHELFTPDFSHRQ